MKCPQCNNTDLEFVSGQFDTGVVAPDGYRESFYEEGFYCPKCNYIYDERDVFEGELQGA
jgi:uncharacterized protein with PIN domain